MGRTVCSCSTGIEDYLNITNMRVLVTGADGFIGRNTLALLVQAGFEVHALCWQQQPNQMEGIHWHRADLMQAKPVDDLLAEIKVSHLLHLAWYTAHGKFWNAPENKDWVAASFELLKGFAKHGGKRVVMAGSCAEYDWSEGICSEQLTPYKPNTLYGASKHGLYEMAAAYCAQNDVSFAWGIVFFLYGPGEHIDRFVPAVINGLLNGEKVPCSDGHQLRDFMHVSDVASAFVALLNSEVQDSVNIASGQTHTLKETGERLMELIGRRGQVEFGALPNRPDDPDAIIANVTRLQHELSWRPSYTQDAGLADTIKWWKMKMDTDA